MVSVFYVGLMSLALGAVLSLSLIRVRQTGVGLFVLISLCAAGLVLLGTAGLSPQTQTVTPSLWAAHWTWLILAVVWGGTAWLLPIRWAQVLWWSVPLAALGWGAAVAPHLPGVVGVSSRLAAGGTLLLTALLMGSVSTAMVVGHWYLVRPSLSIRALERISLAYLGIALARLAWAVGWTLHDWDRHRDFLARWSLDTVFLLQRWGFSLLLAPVLAWMVYQTAKIRSTQSATGILYAAMVVTIVGEFVGLYLWLHRGLMQ
ncbi:MAG: hypothetical protein NZ742_06950 [Acidobacteria bacterium]|nr:hypothetical protein [Acidobacteriota bacterium]MDW7984593.1 hypothetical protein [Acidobacteriota bacterium]